MSVSNLKQKIAKAELANAHRSGYVVYRGTTPQYRGRAKAKFSLPWSELAYVGAVAVMVIMLQFV